MELFFGILCLVAAHAQEAVPRESYRAQGDDLLRQSRLPEAEVLFAGWVRAYPLDPDAHYYLAVSRALQGRAQEAREGFKQVLALDGKRSDACFEIAATFVKDGDNSQALDWALQGLRMEPEDQYGLDLLGTIHYLRGSKAAALRYWNRLLRPHLTELRLKVKGGVKQQRIVEEIDLSPGDLLSWREIEKAQWRLSQHRHLRSVRFDPVPGPTPDEYALEVAVDARRGIGSGWELVFNTLADVGFRTWRLNYWNVLGSGVTLSTKWRWASSARLAQLELDAPRLFHLPLYPGITYGRRDELWSFSPSSTGFQLRTQDVGMRFAIPVRLPALSVTASIVGRERRYAVTPRADPGPSAPDATLADRQLDRRTPGAVWMSAAPRLTLAPRRYAGEWEQRSRFRGEIAGGWTKGRDRVGLSRLSLSADTRVERTLGGNRQQTLTFGLHSGWLSNPGLAEDYFVLGTGPDADFPLRAHPFLRNGRPGSTPLAGRFLLGNLTAASDVKTWSWLKLGIVGFADLAMVSRTYPGQSVPGWLVDTGAGIEIGSPLSSERRFTLAWGRDWRGRRHVAYVAASLR